MKRPLLLLLHLLFCLQLIGQDLPKTELDLFTVTLNFQEKETIRLIKKNLESTKDGSPEQAHMFRQLGILYESINLTDSATYYQGKTDAFWEAFEMQSGAEEYFGQYLLEKGKTYKRAKGISYLDSALLYLSNKEDRMHAEVYRLIRTSIFEEEPLYVERLNGLLERSDLTDDLRGNVLLHAGMGLMTTNYLDSAVISLKQMEGLRLNKFFAFYRQFYLSYIDFLQGNKPEAKRGVGMLEELVAESGYHPKIATPYHFIITEILLEENRYDSAIYHQIRAIEISEQTQMIPENVATLYADLSDTYLMVGDLENAENFTRKAKDLLPATALIVNVELNNSLLKVLLNKYPLENIEARKPLIKEIEELIAAQAQLVLKTKSTSELISFNNLKGHYLMLTERYRLAEAILKEALTSAKDLGDQTIIFNSYQLLSSVYNRQGKFDLSIENATEALKYSNETPLMVPVYELLIESYIGKGMAEEAMEQFEAIRRLKEDEAKAKTDLLLAEFEVKRELETQKLLNESLESEQLVKAQLIERQQMIIIIVCISIIVIAVILFRLRAVHKRNLNLLEVNQKEREELQSTNLELAELVSDLEVTKTENQVLLDAISQKVNRIFNGIKGIRSFIPELGKLNNEQSKYFNRMTDLVEEEEASLNSIIALNSVLGDHKIEISRVSLPAVIKSVKDKAQNILHLNQAVLEVDIKESLVFLADRELIEMTIASLLQHSLSQDLKDKKLKLSVNSNDGLQMVFEFEGGSVSSEVIDGWLSKTNTGHKGYVSKVVQLKDLMDGDLQYLTMGDTHKITLNLNLIEIKTSESKVGEVDELEIDSVYDKVMNYLVKEKGLSNSDLTLVSISEAIAISTRRISFVINTRERTNFSKFLSRLRVEKVKEILDGGVHTHLNIAGIGYEAGFNSKSTFFSSFKEFVGCTPKEYMTEGRDKISA